MLNATESGPRTEWTDEQLASAASEVYFELLDVTFDEVTAATRQCRLVVPTSGGLPALRHAIRRRALGLDATDELSAHIAADRS